MKQVIGYFRIFITVATLLCLAAPGVLVQVETSKVAKRKAMDLTNGSSGFYIVGMGAYAGGLEAFKILKNALWVTLQIGRNPEPYNYFGGNVERLPTGQRQLLNSSRHRSLRGNEIHVAESITQEMGSAAWS